VEGGEQAAAAEQLEKARDLVDLTLGEARSAISGLRPPVLDDLGLGGALASLAASTPEVDLDLHLDDARLPEHIEVALYRIAQECVQNVVKHSRALVATVAFTVRDGVTRLEITDNGVGFDAAGVTLAAGRGLPSSGYGMLSMAERAELVGGTLEVRSQPGTGTAVCVTVPIPRDLDRIPARDGSEP
ncbi:MAG: sensor histidine kinase, partial [Mycobacterium sp.]|nr:sensor histidine kinase [Mycobacterium sp.]